MLMVSPLVPSRYCYSMYNGGCHEGSAERSSTSMSVGAERLHAFLSLMRWSWT